MRLDLVAFGLDISLFAGVGRQTAERVVPGFEVASIKPAAAEILRQKIFACTFGAGRRFTALGPLQWLIACAYAMAQIRAGQEIIGFPPWGNAELFEIMAIAPSDAATASFEDALGMLRTQLSDRFQLPQRSAVGHLSN